MELGAFSVSLAVKDLSTSRAFYEKLGFKQFGGDAEQNWLIMKNGDHTIGLFQGMFDSNIMTFNPGWDKDCGELESFADVRRLRETFRSEGLETSGDVIKGEAGPGSFTLTDPDGNTILIDQHV